MHKVNGRVKDERQKTVDDLNALEEKIIRMQDDSTKRLTQDIQKLEEKLSRGIDHILMEIKRIDDKVDEQNSEELTQQVEHKITQFDGKLEVVAEKLNEVRTNALLERDREARAANLIMYNVLESKLKNKDERWKEDREFCLTMFNKILKVDVREENIKRFIRLGKYSNSQEGNRPILIQFSDRIIKNMIMESLSKLKDSDEIFRKIIVAHDLTKEDREACKKLVIEAREKQQSDTSGEYMYRVHGTPGNLKIVKIKKRN